MKRIFCFLLVLVCIMCTGCSSEEIKTYYYAVDIDPPAAPKSAEEMVDEADYIFEGVVVDIDFCVLNHLRDEEQHNPVEPEEEHCCYLYTIYKVAPIRTYKGNTTLIEEIYLWGGIPDQQKEEQKEVLEQVGLYDPDKGIPLIKGDPKYVQLGETYLFFVRGNDGEEKTALSPYHFAIPEEQIYPAVFTQEELLAHLPYVPNPLLIGGIVVAVLAATAVTTVLIIRKKKKTTVQEEMEPTPEET